VRIARPAVREIGAADIRIALTLGWHDFVANPTHVIFLCAVYPVVGLLLGRAVSGGDLVPLLFPLVAGFTLLGPLAGLGLYEISRRREQGLPTSWHDAFRVLGARNLGAVLLLGVGLMAIFAVWLQTALVILHLTMPDAPHDIMALLVQVLTTWQGWALIVAGHMVGLGFALLVLTVAVVSFPLLLDHNLSGDIATKASIAVATSVAAVARNPGPMLTWGLIVAVALALGSVPFFIGLAVVLPVLGHATWHLYRRTVDPG
jgi:uncharacterized membrane protein